MFLGMIELGPNLSSIFPMNIAPRHDKIIKLRMYSNMHPLPEISLKIEL